MKSVFDDLLERGFVEQSTAKELPDLLAHKRVTVYVGFDPTADSLHLGHLVPIIALAHFQRVGHKVIIVVGGATGMVGDPSGKSEERKLLTPEQVAKNAEGVKKQMAKFLDFTGPNAATILDNNEWISKMTFVDWLREVGKYFTVNYMLAKESIKSRLSSEQGISYTEFSYMTMQAYDFLYLFDKFDCTLQCGGNDQWGNITAGIDLVRKTRGAEVYGITFPLVTTASGEKFGKTAGNAVWLDSERTSPYQFYQYWIRTDDRDAEYYLKLFTFLTREDIENICESHRKVPEEREAQRILAAEMTRTVHGEEGLRKAHRASEVLFGGEVRGFSDEELADIFADVPSSSLARSVLADGLVLIDLLKHTGLCSSRGEARRLVHAGGIYVNNRRVSDPMASIAFGDLASEASLVLRIGKKNYHLVRFI